MKVWRVLRQFKLQCWPNTTQLQEQEVPWGQTENPGLAWCPAALPSSALCPRWGSQVSEAYPDCHECTWARHAGSWPLEHGRDSSQVSEGSWVPGGGGECQDRQKGGPTVANETDIGCVQRHIKQEQSINFILTFQAQGTSYMVTTKPCYPPSKEQSLLSYEMSSN